MVRVSRDAYTLEVGLWISVDLFDFSLVNWIYSQFKQNLMKLLMAAGIELPPSYVEPLILRISICRIEAFRKEELNGISRADPESDQTAVLLRGRDPRDCSTCPERSPCVRVSTDRERGPQKMNVQAPQSWAPHLQNVRKHIPVVKLISLHILFGSPVWCNQELPSVLKMTSALWWLSRVDVASCWRIRGQESSSAGKNS